MVLCSGWFTGSPPPSCTAGSWSEPSVCSVSVLQGGRIFKRLVNRDRIFKQSMSLDRQSNLFDLIKAI
jgi:hypothetical protein